MTASASVAGLNIDLDAHRREIERDRRVVHGWRAFVVAVVVIVVLDIVAFADDPLDLFVFALRTVGRVVVAGACWHVADDVVLSVRQRLVLRVAAMAFVLAWCLVWPLCTTRTWPVSAALLLGTPLFFVDAIVVVAVANTIDVVKDRHRAVLTGAITVALVVVAVIVAAVVHANEDAVRELYLRRDWLIARWHGEHDNDDVPAMLVAQWWMLRGVGAALVWAPLLTCAVAALACCRRRTADA